MCGGCAECGIDTRAEECTCDAAGAPCGDEHAIDCPCRPTDRDIEEDRALARAEWRRDDE